MSEENKNEITIQDIENLYGEDIAFWNKELADTEELYQEMKTQYDRVSKKNSGTPGSFTYLMTQAENLIKLKETKMKIAKERVNTKKISTDTKLSIIRNTKTVEGEEMYEAIAKSMYKQIMEGPSIKETAIVKDESTPTNTSNVDDELEARLAEIEARKKAENQAKLDEEAKFKQNEKELEEISNPPEEDNEVYKYVTNMDKVVIAVDEDYNEIVGAEIPEAFKDIVIYVNDNDELVAASNITGEILEIGDF